MANKILTVILQFSRDYGAPPIALVATHHGGFPTGADALRHFVEAVFGTADRPEAETPLAALTVLAGTPSRNNGKQISALGTHGWMVGVRTDAIAWATGVDRMLGNDAPGFTLRPSTEDGPAPTLVCFTAAGVESEPPPVFDFGPRKGA